MKEKTTEQSAVNISRNTPHCTMHQLSSKACMNLCTEMNDDIQQAFRYDVQIYVVWCAESVWWTYRFISWWWRMQLFNFFCIWRNSSWEASVCPCPSCWSAPSLKCCSDMTYVCLISSSAALSFSSWLQATHTNVAYRLRYPPNTPAMTMAAKTFHKQERKVFNLIQELCFTVWWVLCLVWRQYFVRGCKYSKLKLHK
jgi:hypothetical protein